MLGAALLAAFVGLPLARLLLPFLPALALAWLMDPVVCRVRERVPLSRGTVAVAVLALTLGGAGLLCVGLVRALAGQVTALSENWAAIADRGADILGRGEEWIRRLGDRMPDRLVATGDELIALVGGWLRGLDLSGAVELLAARATGVVSRIPGFLLGAAVFLLASWLLLSDYPRLRYALSQRLSPNGRRRMSRLRKVFGTAFGGYFRCQFLLSLAVFLILGVGFTLMGQSYSLLLALALAVLDFIPLIGAGTVLVPWAAVAMLSGSFRQGSWLLVLWGGVALFRRVAEPRLLGSRTGLPPVAALAGIYGGLQLAGVWGMIFGPVALTVLRDLAEAGLFQPALEDLRLAASDIAAILRQEFSE